MCLTNSDLPSSKSSHGRFPQSIVVSDLNGKPKPMFNFKWWLSALLAALACLQIARGVTTSGDSTAEQHRPQVQCPDLYEASVLELQQGLDAGHFSSVDLVKVCDFVIYISINRHSQLVYTGIFCAD